MSRQRAINPTLIASALALSAVFAQVAPDTAYAQGAPQQVAAQQVKVPMSDQRGSTQADIETSAAILSNDALLVVVRTANPAVLEAVKDGARSAIAQGVPLKGVILASPVANQPDSVDIYADGQNFDAYAKMTNGLIGGVPRTASVVTSSLQNALQELDRDVVQVRLDGKAMTKEKIINK